MNSDNIIISHLFAGYEFNENNIYFGASKMKTAQQHAQEILPLVTAQANGEVIQMYVCGKWHDCMAPTAFVDGCKYRVKPKMMLVNGFEVSEPMRVAPELSAGYFIASPDEIELFNHASWLGDEYDYRWLSRGLCHTTKEAAIAHAKAMLGINPNS